MRKLSIILTLLLVGTFTVTSCGAGDSGSGGASSPKALFEKMKNVKDGSFADIVKFIAPDELPIMTFSMDVAASMMTGFGKTKVTADQYKAIRKKYNLPPFDKNSMMYMRNPQKMMEIAQKTYGKVNHAGFLKAVEKIMGDKSSGVKSTNKASNAKIKNIKITGDTATAVIITKKNETDKIKFRKVNGKWYISIKDMFMRR